MYIPRIISSTFKRALTSFPSVMITGPRQSGKTTFVINELKGSDYVSFDDPLERDFARNDPVGFIKRFGKKSVILDEVQYVPEIINYIKMEIDRERHNYGRWVLTGSQHFNLMKEISESLAGRIAILELMPFCIKETLRTQKRSIEEAIWDGSYPEVVLQPGKRDLWISSYIKTYIERDVRQLMNIKDLRVFEHFLGLLSAYHGQIFNTAVLSREIGVSQPTIKSWAGVLEASYIIYFLKPYFRNYGKRIIKSPKVYFIDSSIVSVLTRQPSPGSAINGSMGGVLFEGFIIIEALKAFLNAGLNPDMFFWRSHDGLEVDLIVQAQGKMHPIEIKLTATPTIKHIEPLEKFKKIAGSDASETGIMVCRVDRAVTLPDRNIALPWHRFYEYMEKLIKAR